MVRVEGARGFHLFPGLLPDPDLRRTNRVMVEPTHRYAGTGFQLTRSALRSR